MGECLFFRAQIVPLLSDETKVRSSPYVANCLSTGVKLFIGSGRSMAYMTSSAVVCTRCTLLIWY